MSPQQLHGKRDNGSTTANNGNGNGNGLCPPPLKINKDSHFIRKSSSSSSSPSSSSSSTSSLVNGVVGAGCAKPPQRHPVIIYTHSPKIIHTHPRDFMALVQKLTGLSRSDDEAGANSPNATKSGEENKIISSKVVVTSDDNESSSVVTTDENCCGSGVVEGQVNSCFAPPMFEPPPPPPPPQVASSYLTNIPVYRPNSTDFLCSNHQPFFNYNDSSLLFGAPNIHSLSSANSTLNGINDFCDYSEY